ncbi:hypothetical protein DRQ36_08535 [bacterium]|nr:MAG: hypothetical protein DRQ36_08535 [bacterium]
MNRSVNKEILLPLRPEFILRRLGYGRTRPTPENIRNRIMGIISEARALIEPGAVYIDADIVLKQFHLFELEGKFDLPGESITRLLKDSEKATVFAGTIGGEITDEVDNRISEGRDDEALFLDAVGSEAAEELARLMHRWAHHRAKRTGMTVTGRFSPGYGDFVLETQREIIEYLGAEEIGISVNNRFMLTPRKSVTGIIGWNSKK